MKTISAADLFCGAGGTSTGLVRACERIGVQPSLIAVNHWDIAVETHAANHPWANHLCAALDNIDPAKAVPSGRLNLLVASPECTHHSLARGGKPCSDQSRASAWLVLKWLQELYVENALIENVQEFTSWGPLGADGRPMKRGRGQTFQAFVGALRSLGYHVDWRVLCAADYGDATTRERLFIIARRGRRKAAWPEASHTRTPEQAEMFGARQPWRPAREIIDWSIPSQSIFSRKKPLAPATIERIAAGLRKFGGKYAEPFLVVLRRHADARSVNEPLPTLTAGGQHIGLCEPFVLPMNRRKDCPIPVDHPMNTITATSADYGLVQPFIAELRSGKDARSIDDPLSTVTTKGAHHALVQPFVMSMEHGRPRTFVLPVHHGIRDSRTYDMDRPMPTITTVDAWGLVEPLVVQYNGTADARPASEPLGSITTRDRFGLVTCDGYALDIHFRMLHWRELAAAHTFPADYRFSGNREQIVKQIGNSVPTELAAALCAEVLAA